mmetsp:Transcript_13868/g.23440  ORF Transcript_13868/g.23440 Transcript_13868/m.23440 type:complete len:211 (-) Transcript_13868:503-1135(-)|eukprot:CAMPEP_0198201130 /NCGR_PEP_ID=MMETSP1445-20131203/3922_1 /TAXON_ID=36898 /ORGANISM="Pyramimonas sp., Strain CCMP2087" /LENGTH=210 /DNA_ID=CAMNT_0043871325 /DNA_START=164 /DNA_END=796 /DNA_ORIENTATION=+
MPDSGENALKPFKNVTVFCGANKGTQEKYMDAAVDLANEMVNRDIGLVYGGGSVGLMGTISTTVHKHGGKVFGVIPKELQPKEISGESVGEVRVVDGMHERKAVMAELGDAFIAMPGGFGTLEELMEIITWQQLGYHRKPVGLLNVDGFYDSLLAFFDQLVAEGFVRPEARGIVLTSADPSQLLDLLQAYQAPESIIEQKTNGSTATTTE